VTVDAVDVVDFSTTTEVRGLFRYSPCFLERLSGPLGKCHWGVEFSQP
jgi:hypothetical protein